VFFEYAALHQIGCFVLKGAAFVCVVKSQSVQFFAHCTALPPFTLQLVVSHRKSAIPIIKVASGRHQIVLKPLERLKRLKLFLLVLRPQI
jgi:hypothetical protein